MVYQAAAPLALPNAMGPVKTLHQLTASSKAVDEATATMATGPHNYNMSPIIPQPMF